MFDNCLIFFIYIFCLGASMLFVCFVGGLIIVLVACYNTNTSTMASSGDILCTKKPSTTVFSPSKNPVFSG